MGLRFIVFLRVYALESAVAVLSSYEENAKWFSRNYERLKKRFNSEWVAVLNRAVLDHDRDLQALVNRLREKHADVYRQIFVEYVSTKELDLL